MMTDIADDAVFSVLTSAQISGLFDALPGLPGNWARLAGTDPGLLGQRDARALAALRAAFAHRRDALLAELARTGLPAVLSALDASEGDEELADFAVAAGRVLGPVAAPAFLTAVASGGDPFALEVSGRLAELRAVAAGTALAGTAPAGTAPAGTAPGGALAALTARTEDLIQRGVVLAEQVRAAAADVAAGVPAARAGRELADWSGAAAEHLAGAASVAAASDLLTLRARLAELSARAEAARTEAARAEAARIEAARAEAARAATVPEREPASQETLRAARLLHDKGLDALIPALLRGAGFEAADDWQAALSPDAEAPREDSAGPAGREPARAPAAGLEREPGARLEPGARPEPAMGPEPAVEPEPTVEPEPAGLPDAEGVPEPAADPLAAVQPEAAEGEPTIQPEPEAQQAGAAQPEFEAQPEPAVQPQPEAEAELTAVPEPEALREPTAETEREAQAEPAALPEPGAQPEATAQPEPEAQAEPGAFPEPDAHREETTRPDPAVQLDPEASPAATARPEEPAAWPPAEARAEPAAWPEPEVHPAATALPVTWQAPEAAPAAEAEHPAEPEPAPVRATAPVRWAFAGTPAAQAVTVPRPPAAAVVPPAPEPAEVPEPGLAPEPAAGPTMDEVQFPWDGSPSLIASLLCAGQDARAVCLAEAAEEPAARQRLLRFFCAAFSCSPAALELQMPALSPPDSEVKELTADECRLLLATVLRVGLSVGYSPVDLQSLIDRAEIGTAQMRAVVAAATEIITHDYRRETGAAVMQRADLVPAWAAFGVRARRLQESLSRGKLPLQRASNVLRHMVLPDEPVGRALALVTDLSELGIGAANTEAQAEKWAHLEAIAGKLSTASGRGRLISDVDEAVSRGTQLRKRIVGVAMSRLDGALQETGKLIAEFLAARTAIRQASAEADLRSAETLPQALDELADSGQPGTAGDAALRRLTGWLRAGAHPADGASVDALVDDELTPLYEIPRDAAGSPVRIPTAAEARELLRGRELPAVVAGYLRTGNIAAARKLVAKADEADQAALDDAVRSGLQAARQRYGQALASAYGIVGRLRAVYDDASARELTVLANQAQAPEDDRFDLATGRLVGAVTAGEERLRGHREELRARARRCDCEEAGRQRILSLIDRDDEVLAVEFLTMAEAGQPLPEGDAEHGDDFAAFFPAMVDVAVTAARQRKDAVAAVRAFAGAAGPPASRNLAAGLNAWRELKSGKRGLPVESFRKLVADVLRMIGLVPWDQTWLQELSRTQRSGYATFRVRATPVDRSYVPGLGTQAGSDYDLTLVWDEVTPTRLLDFIDERRRTRANIIVYFNTLDPAQRLQLRRSTRHNTGKGFSPVVVDDAVAAWLTTLAEPGWRFTQRVTLPFTTMNPYSPFAGGEVPEEVFVGREQERAEIESPTGSMFVYGGRQLGKSALLRRVERMFSDQPAPPRASGWQARSGRVAVYLDLKAASIGEAREPSALWPVLAERLVAEQVLPREASRTTAPDKVSKLISDWLSADSGNRLLLLLDEADNFLTKDSQARRSGSGAEFPNLQRLKELMGNSERRFKAVFAGLHQVQRFHDSSNTPVAHGGNDIPIGPLLPIAAYRLLVDPMTALGYEFASEEHVWRLLLFANYQASLVQIVCEALVREMARKELPPGGRRIVIDAADIEAVISRREVRDLIVQRFWWTINLDPRYRVIALVVAARSLDGEPGETFTPEDLHEFCELYWDAGFSRAQLSGKEFRRYLEEMVGLGVLYRQDDEFGLRSPNILSLLGTRQSIDQDLADAPRELEVRDEYNPSTNRRIIGKSTELWVPRSPLTDRDIAGLLGIDGQPHGRVQLVTGSSALGIDRAAAVIRDVAEEQEIRCEIRHQGELYSLPRRRSHLVVDLSGAPSAAGDLPVAYLKLSEFADVRATIIVGPDCVPLRLEGLAGADVTPVRRWSAEGLRSWHDTPFTTPDMRARLYRVTSGWPLLVEETMREITAGKSPDDALGLIMQRLAQPFFARRHLASCGIDAGLAARWAAAFGVVGDDGLAEAFPVTADELGAELGIDVPPVLERLQVLDAVEDTPHGWVLDRAVFAAAAALGA